MYDDGYNRHDQNVVEIKITEGWVKVISCYDDSIHDTIHLSIKQVPRRYSR